jgi:hypothetical protein
MVCMAVMLSLSARDAAGKIMFLWFPVVIFVLCSFEHCLANSKRVSITPDCGASTDFAAVFFCSLGLMYGAHSNIGRLWYNQSAAVLGNLVGGVIFIGLMEHLLNHWSSPVFRAHHPQAGTLVGHDVESTRRARDDHGQLEADGDTEIKANNRDDLQQLSQTASGAEPPKVNDKEEHESDRSHTADTPGNRPNPRPVIWGMLSRSRDRVHTDGANQV